MLFVTAEHAREESLNAQAAGVNAAADHERPVRAVPEASEQHREHQIAVRAALAVAAAPEWNVQVVAKPGAEADVPAPPEILQAGGEVRLTEVHHEMKPEQLRTAA